MNTAVNRRSVLVGLGAVGAFLAVDLGAVAYANKWIGSGATRKTFLDGFLSVYGRHLGFRKNHAKGVVVTGYFDSNGKGQELSRAAVFRPGQYPVVGRFSLAGATPSWPIPPAPHEGSGWRSGFPTAGSGAPRC